MKDNPEYSDDLTTHGICEECKFHLKAQKGMPTSEYLDHLDAPVVIVDSDANVTAANISARGMLGKELDQIIGNPGGNVFECEYAYLPEGCGKTIHCSACTIRKRVIRDNKPASSIYVDSSV